MQHSEHRIAESEILPIPPPFLQPQETAEPATKKDGSVGFLWALQ